MNTVGKNIKKLREEKGITQEVMAESLNVTRQAVSNWENGKSEPDLDTLHSIASFFSVTVEEIIYGSRSQPSITNVTNVTKEQGFGFGSIIAVVISYVKWHSIGWAIIHGALSWIYVLYFIIRYHI